MRGAWVAFATFVSNRTAVVLTAVAVTTVVLGLGLPRLDFATGQDSYLNDGEQITIDNTNYQNLFGGQAMVTLYTAPEGQTAVDLFTTSNVTAWEAAADEIRAIDGVDGAVSPITALEWTRNLLTPRDADGNLMLDADGNPIIEVTVADDGTPSVSLATVSSSIAGELLLGAIDSENADGNTEAADARLADSAATVGRLAVAAQGGTAFDNPEWVEFLLTDNDGNIRSALRPFFPVPIGENPTLENARYTQMLTRLTGNASIDEEGKASDAVLAAVESQQWENAEVLTTGAPVLLKDLNDYLQSGMLILGGAAAVVMLIVLFIVFRVRWRLLSLGVVAIGIVWGFGLLGWAGFDLSLVTIAGLPILIGMGIDFAIQIHNRVEEEVVLDRSESPFTETLANIGPPLLIAAIAAGFAFMAMQFSAVPMVRDFGVLLTVGIAVLLVAGLIVPTAVLGLRERRKPTTAEADHARIERAVVKLGSLPQWTVVPLIVLGLVLFGFGILAEDAFTIETDPEKWVDQNTQVLKDLNQLQESTGSASELGVFIEAEDSVFTDDVAAFMTEFALAELDQNAGDLLTASSLPTTVAYATEVPGTPLVAPTGADIELAYSVAPPDIQRSLVGDGGRAANVVFRTGPSELDLRKKVVDNMRSTLEPPPAVRATPAGLAVVGVGLLENIEKNRTELTYYGLAMVAVWLLIRFRSPSKAVMSLVPVLLAVGTSSLIVAAAGFKLSPLTTISGPLVIATCTEFSALILTRYIEERRRGLVAREATDVASARTGRAFVASAFTTVGGFGVLMFSSLPLLRDFGAIVTLNVAVALLSALVVLPPLMVWFDEKNLLKTTGAPRGIGPADG